MLLCSKKALVLVFSLVFLLEVKAKSPLHCLSQVLSKFESLNYTSDSLEGFSQFKRLEIGKRYPLYLKPGSAPLKARFVGIFEEDGKTLFVFRTPVKKIVIQLEDSSSAPYVLKENTAFQILSFIFKKFENFMSEISVSSLSSMGKLSLIKKTDHLEVLSDSPELATNMLPFLQKFDDFLEALSLSIPNKTRVIFSQAPPLAIFSPGPIYLNTPILNIFRGSFAPSILMIPIKDYPNFPRSITSLLHERAHSFLYHNFNHNAFVTENTAVQEALADFLVSLALNKPQIGQNIYLPGFSIRNIKLKSNLTDRVTGITSLADKDFHQHSLLFSNTLWKLLEETSRKEIASLMRPFMEDLNRYRTHFESLEKGLSLTNDTVLKAQYNLEYFLSVLAITGKAQNLEDPTAQVIKSVANEFDLDLKRINHFSNELRPSAQFYNEKAQELWIKIIPAHGLGALNKAPKTAGVGVSLYFLYKLTISQEDYSEDP